MSRLNGLTRWNVPYVGKSDNATMIDDHAITKGVVVVASVVLWARSIISDGDT